jgi:hypothetical protein
MKNEVEQQNKKERKEGGRGAEQKVKPVRFFGLSPVPAPAHPHTAGSHGATVPRPHACKNIIHLLLIHSYIHSLTHSLIHSLLSQFTALHCNTLRSLWVVFALSFHL